MKTSELITILQKWEDHHRAIDESYEALHELTGAMPDCVLLAPVYRLLDAYDDAIAKQIGDEEGWLSWYAYENDLGAKGFQVRIPNKKPFKVDSVAKLARCIK